MKQRNTAWARKVIGGTLLLLSVVATVLVPRPTFAGENGQQLVIKLPAGYKMTHLRIEGTFYTDENVVWDHALSPSNVYFLKDWWWKDTVLLQFNVKGLEQLPVLSTTCLSNKRVIGSWCNIMGQVTAAVVPHL